MQLKVGQSTVIWSSEGLRFIVPVAEHEISVRINFMPDAVETLEVQLNVTRVGKDEIEDAE